MSQRFKRLLLSMLAAMVFCALLGLPEVESAANQERKAQVAPGGALQTDGAIRDLLTRQVAAWNSGDIDGFMQGYWRSEETTFSGTSGVSRGWQALLERYHRNYPNRAAMGHLDFSEIEITSLGDNAALILGDWHLDRESGPIGGVFTLVARRFPEGWRIIHDHTSTVAVDKPASQ